MSSPVDRRSLPLSRSLLARRAGSATIELTGTVLLIAALLLAASLYLSGSGGPAGRELGQRIANRIACGPRVTEACRQHPAVSAYGWPLARLLRFMAPMPIGRPGAAGQVLVPVDFRYCQRPSCAMPRPGETGTRLTTANRRITVFTEVADHRRTGGTVDLTYWLYRPGLGWEDLKLSAGAGEIEAASGTRVLLKDSPRLVPLEILPGRNHYELPPGDEPPWRWRVTPRHDGRSA